MMRPTLPVGIVGYGAYVPRYRLAASEIARVWPSGGDEGPVTSKSVPGPDEDTVTMSIEAARNALARASVDPGEIGAVWVGSESHPYAVKPTSTIVAEAIGAVPRVLAGDWQFACKAGTEALQAAIGLVGSGMARYALAIGMDAAQGRPGDALEFTAAAGGAAILVGLPARPWRTWKGLSRTSPTRRTFGVDLGGTIPSTLAASPGSQPTLPTPWRPRGRCSTNSAGGPTIWPMPSFTSPTCAFRRRRGVSWD